MKNEYWERLTKVGIISILQKMDERLTRLEQQAQTYFPLEYHETNATDGVDNIKVEFTNPDMNIKEIIK